MTTDDRLKPAFTSRNERHHDDRGGGHPRNGVRRDDGLAQALGLFSIGLGALELAIPGELARWIGAEDNRSTRDLLRALGARELTSGFGILSSDQPAGWVWSRVGGDVMDLAVLGAAMAAPGAQRGRLAAAAAAVAGVTVLDALCAARLGGVEQLGSGRRPARARRGAHWHAGEVDVTATAAINKPVAEVFAFWRELTNLPRFMNHLERVEVLDSRRSRWTARAPAGTRVQWQAEISEERPGELLAWRSLADSQIRNSGRVTFQPGPGGRGTRLTVQLRYAPPGGRVGAVLARLFGEEPRRQVAEDLRLLKQVLEAGEAIRSDHTVNGGGPARPMRAHRLRDGARASGRVSEQTGSIGGSERTSS